MATEFQAATKAQENPNSGEDPVAYSTDENNCLEKESKNPGQTGGSEVGPYGP